MLRAAPAQRRALLAAGLAGAAFAALAVLVVTGSGGELDGRLAEWVAARRTEPLTRAVGRFTDLGAWHAVGPIVAATSLWLYVRGLRRDAAYVAACTAASWGLNLVLKALVQRPTPGPAYAVEQPALYAFPSGHTMTTTTFVTALALVLCTAVLGRRRRVAVTMAAAVYATLMGLSRVYLGVHWPSDVVGGWLLGAALALAAWTMLGGAERVGRRSL